MILVSPRCNLFPTTALIYGAGPLVFDTHDFFLSGLHVRKRGGSAWHKRTWIPCGSADRVAADNVRISLGQVLEWVLEVGSQYPGLKEAASHMFEALWVVDLPKGFDARWVVADDRFEVDTTFAVSQILGHPWHLGLGRRALATRRQSLLRPRWYGERDDRFGSSYHGSDDRLCGRSLGRWPGS